MCTAHMYRYRIMPMFNGTGPDGNGPKTGRGLGTCPSSVRQTPQTAARRVYGTALGRGGRPKGLGRRRGR